MAGQGSDFRRELGQQLRVDSIRCSAAAGSGHPTSSMSAADLMAVLLDGHLRLDYQNPANPANDHHEMRSTRGTNLSVRCEMPCAHEEGLHTDEAI